MTSKTSHFVQVPEVELFRLGGIRCADSQFSTRQLCSTTHFVRSYTGVGNPLAHPLVITVVDILTGSEGS